MLVQAIIPLLNEKFSWINEISTFLYYFTHLIIKQNLFVRFTTAVPIIFDNKDDDNGHDD